MGINNGQYADKVAITGDLHPFQEMYLDKEGNPVWVYDVKDTTGEGSFRMTFLKTLGDGRTGI